MIGQDKAKSEFKTLSRDKLPQALFDEIRNSIIFYTVGLIGHGRELGLDDDHPIGSGVLVRVGRSFGVLTAQHVVDSPKFLKSQSIGLVLKNRPHRFEIERRELRAKVPPANKDSDQGPDLSVIQLPESRVGYIESSKCFWNLEKGPQRPFDDTTPKEYDYWCIAGFPEAGFAQEQGNDSFDVLGRVGIFFAFCTKHSEYTAGGHDYMRFLTSYAGGSGDTPPASFGGCSGGGLWRVGYECNANGTFTPRGPFLAGMVFEETKLSGGSAILTCHGAGSVFNTGRGLLIES